MQNATELSDGAEFALPLGVALGEGGDGRSDSGERRFAVLREYGP